MFWKSTDRVSRLNDRSSESRWERPSYKNMAKRKSLLSLWAGAGALLSLIGMPRILSSRWKSLVVSANDLVAVLATTDKFKRMRNLSDKQRGRSCSACDQFAGSAEVLAIEAAKRGTEPCFARLQKQRPPRDPAASFKPSTERDKTRLAPVIPT